MSDQQPNEEPPLILRNYDKILIVLIIFTILLVAGLVYSAQRWAKEPTELEIEIPFNSLFLSAENPPIIHTEFLEENYLISKAPPFIVEGKVLMSIVEEDPISKADRILMAKIIECESHGDPTARNPKSTAYGLCQFLDGTWKYVQEKWDMKLDRKDYYDQHYACRRLMKEEGMIHWEETKLCWSK